MYRILHCTPRKTGINTVVGVFIIQVLDFDLKFNFSGWGSILAQTDTLDFSIQST